MRAAAVPLGSNTKCDGRPRIRRNWDALSPEDKDLYVGAVQTAVDRGLYQAFFPYHADTMSSIQSHETCAFSLWHRHFLLAFENMLRSLDKRFACLTVPYWNVMDHYRDQQQNRCNSYGTCAKIVFALGGTSSQSMETRRLAGVVADGVLHVGKPIEGMLDDTGRPGIVRAELWFTPIPNEASYEEIINIVQTSPNYVDFGTRMQRGIHDAVHDSLGGFMPTYSSPADPLFFPWHSTIDLFLFMWEVCYLKVDSFRRDVPAYWAFLESSMPAAAQSLITCHQTEQSQQFFPVVNATSESYIKIGNTDVRIDPVLGPYFQGIGDTFSSLVSARHLGPHNDFVYDDVPDEIYAAVNDGSICPAATSWTRSPTMSPTPKPPSPSSPELSRDDWIELVVQRLNEKYPDDLLAVQQHLQFAICVLDRQDESRRNDYDLITQIVDGTIQSPACGILLPSAKDSSESVGHSTTSPVETFPLHNTSSSLALSAPMGYSVVIATLWLIVKILSG